MSAVSIARRTPGLRARDLVAVVYGVEARALTREIELAEAVGVIARNCGIGTLPRMMGSDGCLKVSEILRIARKGPDRQRYEMRRADGFAELHPGRFYEMNRPGEGDWPMDTRDFAKVPGRLGRAIGNVEDCIAAFPALPDHARPTGVERAEIRRHLEGIVACSGQLLRHVEAIGTGEPVKGERITWCPEKDHREGVTTFDGAIGFLDAARYFVEKTAKDIPGYRRACGRAFYGATQIRAQLGSLVARPRALLRMVEAGSPGTVRPG